MNTARIRLSARDLAKLFAEHNGRCHLCGLRIEAGQKWERSHPIPLAAGGKDEWANWALAHARCHKRQTAEIDAPTIAKVRRQHQKHIGIRAEGKRPFPGGRNSRWRKKINGRVEERT